MTPTVSECLPVLQRGTVTVPAHPLGIKPAGNAYAATENIRFKAGSFAILTDELLLQVLEFLDASSLSRLGGTCKALYAFSRFDDLWKSLSISSSQSMVKKWQGTWRSTFLQLQSPESSHVSCSGLFSDALHRPFFCAHTSLVPYTTSIPKSNAIKRLSNLTAAEFFANWANKPFVLTEPVREWPVYKGWSIATLLEKYSDVPFRAEAVDWPLKTYVEYMQNNTDESPLYLFDRSFVEKMDLCVGKDDGGDYWAPECFGEDLFAVLGNQRPDSRWLIIGPARSGSTFHKDPNATSAWNAVLRGSKYWIMFPTSASSPPPPGVFVSEDQSEVTSPLSIAEWLMGFHAEARETHGCLEGICGEGEVLHVPSGWWHLVVNLAPSIAITQNFIPRKHVSAALAFLKHKPDQVSGFPHDVKSPYDIFVHQLHRKHPDLLGEALAEVERKGTGQKRKWDDFVNGKGTENPHSVFSFDFGFSADDGDEIP